jgi:hypothetical protein
LALPHNLEWGSQTGIRNFVVGEFLSLYYLFLFLLLPIPSPQMLNIKGIFCEEKMEIDS